MRSRPRDHSLRHQVGSEFREADSRSALATKGVEALPSQTIEVPRS